MRKIFIAKSDIVGGMQAVICHDFNESSVEEVPRPEPAAGEVLLEVLRVQLSVTECNLYRGEKIAHAEAVSSRLGTGGVRLFGHEFCGKVVETGEQVTDYSQGDRVYAPGKIPCFECSNCEAGYEHFCQNKTNIGYERPGALAEYFTVPTYPLEKLPDEISNAEGAAMQPFASSVVSTHDAEITSDDVVLVLGQGVIGSQCAQLAKHQGASRVFGTDVVDRKLDIAESNGIEPIDVRNESLINVVMNATDGVGADVVIDAVGGNQNRLTDGSDPIAQGFKAIRTGGLLLQVGHIVEDISMTASKLRDKCLTWRHPRRGNPNWGPNSTPGTYATELVSRGQVTIDDHITHELSGLESFEEAVEITLNKEEYDALGPAQIIPS
jgi:threonine dehydrogenase-like Zn-dependent dehydrogenase